MLTEHGYGDVLYEVVANPNYPGWGYMVKKGATTIWESWEQNSRAGGAESMIMWATVDEFFYNDLAGIKGPEYYGPNYMTPGFREIHIKPYIPNDLEYASASIKTVRGIISSSWRKRDSLILEVSIPVNSHAAISIPKMGLKNVTIEENGETIWQNGSFVNGVEGITDGREKPDYIMFDVGSGSYSFQLK
jgi:alpha-L-rhamnosidase